MAIKPPSGVGSSQPTQPTQPAQKTTQTKAPAGDRPATNVPSAPVVNPEAVAKALKDYQKLRQGPQKNFLSGAAGLFTDNIIFPSDLLDTTNPANDPKYLHLLFTLIGVKEMARRFATKEQQDEMDEEENEEDEKEEED